MAAKVERCGGFFTIATGKWWRDACHDGAIGHNGVFIWHTFGLPPSTINNTGLFLFYKTNV